MLLICIHDPIISEAPLWFYHIYYRCTFQCGQVVTKGLVSMGLGQDVIY